MTSSEHDIVRRFRSGAPGGFDDLYDRWGPRVYRFCRRLTPTVADAEDLTQEVFLAAYVGRDRFEGRSSIMTWILRIAVFAARNQKRCRRVDTVPIVDSDEARLTSADLASGEIARLALASALDKLPCEQREAFVLVRAEGLTCREAADALGIPEATLKFRVQRAATRLQLLLADPVDNAGAEGKVA